MDNIKDDNYYLEKIISDLQFVVDHTKNKKKEEIEKDEVLLDSVMFRLFKLQKTAVN